MLNRNNESAWISDSSQNIIDYFQKMEIFFHQLYQDIEDEYKVLFVYYFSLFVFHDFIAQEFSSKEAMSNIKTSFESLMNEGKEALESVKHIVDEGKTALKSMNIQVMKESKIKLDSLKNIMQDGRKAYNQTITKIQVQKNINLSI